MAALTARRSVTIDAPPEVVWRIHTDIDIWSQWHKGVSRARTLSTLGAGTAFEWKSGGLTIRSTIRTWEPNRSISWMGSALGTRAMHSWTLEPQHGRTLVTTEESMEGWLVSLLARISPSFLEQSLDEWLRDLKSAAEGGASTTTGAALR